MTAQAHIRELLPSDLDLVLELENDAHVIPWEYHHFQQCLESGYQALLLEQQDCLLGYCLFQVVRDETTLMNIAVASAKQGKGYGQQLMQAFFDRAKSLGCTVAFLEVRQSNDRAIKLYQQLGFEQAGFRKDYYPALEGRENALLFYKNL